MPWHVKNWKWLRWIVAILFASVMTVIAVLIYQDSAVPADILASSFLGGSMVGYATFHGVRKLFLWMAKRPDLIHKGRANSNAYRQNEAMGDITCLVFNGLVLYIWIHAPLDAAVPTIVWFGFWSALGTYNAKLESDSSPL